MAKHNKRIRALNIFDDVTKSEWLVYNPLFHQFIPEFDESFNRGVHLNLDYYVPRNGVNYDFEDEFCNILFSVDSNRTTKIYNLAGNVGSGKSCLCRYIIERVLPKQSNLGIYIDVWPAESQNTKPLALNDLFIKSTFISLQQLNYVKDYKSFCEGVLEILGWQNMSPSDIIKASKEFEPEYILQYLNRFNTIKNILIVIDNIDESSAEIISSCRNFSLDIVRECRNLRNTNFSILVPAREYTITKYFDQEHFAIKSLANIEEKAIVSSKLQQAGDSIKKSFRTYTQPLDYSRIKGPYQYPNISVTVTKESAVEFLQKLSSISLSKEEQIFFLLIKALANKNLKMLTGNMYNFIHSCKLPLSKLFNKVFLTPLFFGESTESITFEIGLEALMSIHYPFYDVTSSHIINLFNLNHSISPGDYKNTLSIPRLLCFLKNRSGIPKSEIIAWFMNYGYSEKHLIAGIDKCFNYGLIISNHGSKSKDLVDDSMIYATSIANFYLDVLMCTITYLSFAHDDTPVTQEYSIDIHTKYDKAFNPEDKKFSDNMKDSASKLLNFIMQEEELERRYIIKLGYNYDDFISQTGIYSDDRIYSISSYISSHKNRLPSLLELRKYVQ